MNGTSNPTDSDGIWVIGAGGHAKVVIETIQASGNTVAGVLDSDPLKNGMMLLGLRVSAPFSPETLAQRGVRKAVLAIGDNEARKRISESTIGTEWQTVIHPFSYVSPHANLQAGSQVLAGAIIQADTVIGKHTIVNTGSKIDHESFIEAFAHIGPGTSLAGNVRIGEGVLAGIGSTFLPNISIGDWAIIGGGAVVTKNMPRRAIASGVPARIKGYVN